MIPKQAVIRDPGGDKLVRVITSTKITDGSIIIVPADTVAFVVINGKVSPPYCPGRWTINTGVNPFFVEFRNLMTGGDAGIAVSVFYVATYLERHVSMGTGDVLFSENRYKLSMVARASFAIDFRISDARVFVGKLVGMHRSAFTQEDIEPKLYDILRGPVVEAMSLKFAAAEVAALNRHLTEISNAVKLAVNGTFNSYGIELVRFNITHINIADEYMQRLRELEQYEAKEKLTTDTEAYNIKKIYGNVNNRTYAEAITGTARGNYPPPNNPSGVGGICTLAMQLAMLNRLPPDVFKPFSDIATDTARSDSTDGGGLPPIVRNGDE